MAGPILDVSCVNESILYQGMWVIKNPITDEKKIIDAIEYDPDLLKYIKNQTSLIQIIAIKSSYCSIAHIDQLCDDTCIFIAGNLTSIVPSRHAQYINEKMFNVWKKRFN